MERLNRHNASLGKFGRKRKCVITDNSDGTVRVSVIGTDIAHTMPNSQVEVLLSGWQMTRYDNGHRNFSIDVKLLDHASHASHTATN